jgi:hypothetical protein
MRTNPWHSILPNEPFVYHFNEACTLGDNIQPEYKVEGSDGRRPCTECERLSVRDSRAAAQAYLTRDDDPMVDIAPRRLGQTAAEVYDPLAGIAPPRRLGK